MKIRTDFVTNSSSSSFCSINISGSNLNMILEKYKELFESEDFEGCEISLTDTGFDFADETGGYFVGPDSKEKIAKSFTGFIEELSLCCEDPEKFDELIEELEENESEINNTITSLNWHRIYTGWGENKARFSHRYDFKEVRGYLGLGNDIEITDEIKKKFIFGVRYARSQSDTTWKYDGTNFEVNEIFDLFDNGQPETIPEEILAILDPKEIAIRESWNIKTYSNIESSPFYGKNFATTSLDLKDKEIVKQIVESNGGTVKSSVSRKIDYLILSDDYDYDHETTKYKKAKELIAKGKLINIITYDQFWTMIE